MMKSILLVLPAMLLATAGGASISGSPSAPCDSPRPIIRELAAKADSGDAEALYQMALLHDRGFDSIPRDSILSLSLLRRSADKGNLKAQNLLGYKLMQSGDSSGLEWIEKAAIAGDPKAQGNIGYLLLNSKIVERDPRKASYWLERAANAGIATASSMLGDLYKTGEGVARDTLQAETRYCAAIDAGLADAAYKLADMLGEKWKTLPDSIQYGKAVYLYTHRAPDAALPIFRRLGDNAADKSVKGKSLAMIGDAYTRGAGVAYDHDKSLEYYFRAASVGDPSAAFVIGELLEIFPDSLNGLTSDKDMHQAEYWYSLAASQGVATAESATLRLHGKP